MSWSQTPTWQALADHYRQMAPIHMRDLFREDVNRFSRFSVEGGGIFLDYSKNRITNETMRLLFDLAWESGLSEAQDLHNAGDHEQCTKRYKNLRVGL